MGEAEHYVPFVLAGCTAALAGWFALCHRTLLQRRVTVADLLALVLLLGIVFGIASWL